MPPQPIFPARATFSLPIEDLEKIDILAEKKRLNRSAILRQAVATLIEGQKMAA